MFLTFNEFHDVNLQMHVCTIVWDAFLNMARVVSGCAQWVCRACLKPVKACDLDIHWSCTISNSSTLLSYSIDLPACWIGLLAAKRAQSYTYNSQTCGSACQQSSIEHNRAGKTHTFISFDCSLFIICKLVSDGVLKICFSCVVWHVPSWQDEQRACVCMSLVLIDWSQSGYQIYRQRT